MRRFRVLFVSAIVLVGVFGVPRHVAAQRAFPAALDHRHALASSLQPGEVLRRSVTLPWRANMVGVSFLGEDRDAEGLRITMRHRDGERWSGWIEIRVDDDEQPDEAELRRASPRVATLPQWVDLARHVEVVVSLEGEAAPIHDLRLETMNTNGDAHPESVLSSVLGTVGRFLTMVPAGAPAEAAASKPPIISRAEWGADESLRSKGPGIADRLEMAHIHHTANSNSYSKSESASLVRGIYRYHTKTRGYSDIGYNFLVDRYGQIFEGRHGGIGEAVIGGHAAGFNGGSTGIGLIGTFGSSTPPSAMLSSLKKLLAWKLDFHHVPPVGTFLRESGGSSKYSEGKIVRLDRISGHRDTSSTACPGGATYDLLPSIRNAVNAMGRPKIYVPEVAPEELRLTGVDHNGPFTAGATFSDTVTWRFEVTDGAGDEVFVQTGTGTSMSVTWDGRVDGSFVPSGTYGWRIRASKGSSTAREPFGTIDVSSDWVVPYWDDDGSPFEADIRTITDEGISNGCGDNRFCPLDDLTRGQMAAFLSRAMKLPPATNDYFTDDGGSVFEDSINRIARAGITTGCGGGRFCPGRSLTRAEMAAFLARAKSLPPGVLDHFDDDAGSPFEADINRIADALYTNGCGERLYCPTRLVTRGEMAAFLVRAFNL